MQKGIVEKYGQISIEYEIKITKIITALNYKFMEG